MRTWINWLRKYCWTLALAAALAFVATDTAVHVRKTRWLTAMHNPYGLPPDPASPSGYADNQHEVILPYTGLDGFHWILQTQQMFADGGLRVREVAYDNAPDGREVHWSSALRWWLAAVAWLDHLAANTPLPQAVEQVIPFSNTLLIMLIILGVVPVMARRFGPGDAALLALAMVAVGPFYESYAAGRGDHHGLAAMNALLTLLLLVAGGAGWVRSDYVRPATPESADDAESDDVTDQALLAWMPERAQARRWFIASGIVGGFGLWISAASQAPVLVEIGLGALFAGLLGRHVREASVTRPDPTLWRVWGLSGAATSLFFYLLEYFPSHLGMRLEVNHPLYALAWAGGGELLCRLCLWMNGQKPAATTRDRAALAASIVAVLLLPLTILIFRASTFWVADPFLWQFHHDYILEFLPLWTYLESQSLAVFIIMANPLVLLAVWMFAWSWRRGRTAVVWALVPVFLLCTAYLWMGSALSTRHIIWLMLLAGSAALLLFLGVWPRWPKFPRAARALMFLTLPAGVASFALALWQVRWVEVSYALWITALVATVQACKLHPNFRWTWMRQIGAVALLAWVLLPLPAFTLWSWTEHGWRAQPEREEYVALVTRDLARNLRARSGAGDVVVLSDPTTTTWLIYYGGFKGLGTFYWENLAGLKTSADIMAAKSEDAALTLLQQHGVKYLVFPSWSTSPAEFARLARGLPKEAPPPMDAFALHMLKTPAFPRWTRPATSTMLAMDQDENAFVFVLEVVPEQSVAEACVRYAEWQLETGDRKGALANVNAALKTELDYLPALLIGARLQHSAHDAVGFDRTLRRIRVQLPHAAQMEFEHRVDLALVLGLANDSTEARTQIGACLADATEKNLRELRPDALFNLLSMARMAGMLETRPGFLARALPYLPERLRTQFLSEYAHNPGTAQGAGAPQLQP